MHFWAYSHLFFLSYHIRMVEVSFAVIYDAHGSITLYFCHIFCPNGKKRQLIWRIRSVYMCFFPFNLLFHGILEPLDTGNSGVIRIFEMCFFPLVFTYYRLIGKKAHSKYFCSPSDACYLIFGSRNSSNADPFRLHQLRCLMHQNPTDPITICSNVTLRVHQNTWTVSIRK